MCWRGAILLGALSLVSCARQPGPEVLAGKAFGTFWEVRFVATAKGPAVRARVETALSDWDSTFNTWRSDSEISKFNDWRSTQPFPASARLVEGVGRALQLAERTGGAFDPTVRPLLRLYGFGAGTAEVASPPDQATIDAVMELVGWRKLTSDRAASTLVKSVGGLEIDLSAIAKGAGVDHVAAALLEIGVRDFVVNIGGEVVCRGHKPGGVPWRLGIEDPGRADPNAATATAHLETVALRDEALATSGSYRQFRVLGGRRHHHILDPRTGRNADSAVVSVSVRATSCELADGLATALMVTGPDAAEAIFGRCQDRRLGALFLLVGTDGRLERRLVRWPKE